MRILLIFCFVFLWGNNYELELYETVFTKLFHKNTIYVYFQNNHILKSDILIPTKNCKLADIVVLEHLPNPCLNKPYFVTSYVTYINSNAVGAFYWRKNRPQLKLNKRIIDLYNLYLDNSLKKYAK